MSSKSNLLRKVVQWDSKYVEVPSDLWTSDDCSCILVNRPKFPKLFRTLKRPNPKKSDGENLFIHYSKYFWYKRSITECYSDSKASSILSRKMYMVTVETLPPTKKKNHGDFIDSQIIIMVLPCKGLSYLLNLSYH